MIGRLLSRGQDVAGHFADKYGYKMQEFKPPVWGVVLVAITAFAYLLASFAIEYTFSHLIPSLVMVESTEAVLFEPIEKEDPDAIPDSKLEQELFLIKQQPITSSFCRTIKLLHSVGGFCARFRGLSVYVFSSVLAASVNHSVAAIIPLSAIGISEIITAVLFANLWMAWTHIVISAPSELPWFRRVPTYQSWKKIAGPTAYAAVAEQISVLFPVGLILVSGIADISPEDRKNMSSTERHIVVLKTIGIIITTFATLLFVALPARVALTRIHASLLPEDQKTIVPVDRSFSGKVNDMDEHLTIRDALKTFERSSRIRLIKTYAKGFFMQVALAMVFFTIVAGEVVLIIGPSKIMEFGCMGGVSAE
ncbi:hypothetical protein BJ878DRAFT_564724 [Calycina marina]|uniref:Uncharacterized protein n=1 Tax=Calycina marina TaxID=1763456 RepID=A0A9P7Z9A4_9HELO|nr:hypothetical protein BJ878DRAFT_564724 [Calycina marina]